ncbi:MAG TPA: hypothetical protein PLA87_08005 [Pseudomonadota bacterium]|nr:hypothetical protein [Pseudomonadota bacterium]
MLTRFPLLNHRRSFASSTFPLALSKTVQALGLIGLTLAATACGSSSNATEDLSPPPAGQGVQFKMVTTLDPGLETERCQFFVAPPEGLLVNHDEVRYTPGSHHVLLYLTEYPAIPTKDNHGKVRDTSKVMDCPTGATSDWSVSGVIAGAQSFSGGSMVSLPEDTAVRVPGGAVLLMNTHYLNASPKPLAAEARINVYTVPADKMKQEGGLLFFYNPIIRIPQGSTASARMRCRVSKDITVTNVQSHMHKRGINYEAQLLDKDLQPQQTFYTNKEWEDVPVKKFEPGLPVKAGSYFDYRCDYKNSEATDIVQGPSTKDEMCMLIGSYYPRNPDQEGCEEPMWVGNGNKSCGLSAACALSAAAVKDFGGFYQCILDSCESAAKPLTDTLVCYFEQGGDACTAKCKGPAANATECQACTSQACQPKMDSCKAAACK